MEHQYYDEPLKGSEVFCQFIDELLFFSGFPRRSQLVRKLTGPQSQENLSVDGSE